MDTKKIFTGCLTAIVSLIFTMAAHAQHNADFTKQCIKRPAKLGATIGMQPIKRADYAPIKQARTGSLSTRAEESTTVISEDFSKFTAGSVDNPDNSVILNSEGLIMQDYIQTYGWAGYNLYQAGGCCFIADGTEAFLCTPVLDLSSNNGDMEIDVSFRSQSGTCKFYCIVLVTNNGTLEAADGGYIDATTEWQRFKISFTGGTSQTLIQIYGDAPIFVDNISIMQQQEAEQDVLTAPIALDATNITETSFTANWNAVNGATGYLLDVFYYENNQPQYVKENIEVTETSYNVTDLEAGRLYFYSVQATDGTETTEESNSVPAKEPADYLDTPQVLAATNVDDNGFTANWNPVDNAALYELITQSERTVAENGTYTVEEEDFNGVDVGTAESPVYHDMQGSFNAYTKYPDWYGMTTMLANGMIGMKNYYASAGVYSMIYTPIYIIGSSNTPGNVKMTATIKTVNCSTGTEIGAALVNASTNEIIGDWMFQALTQTTQTVNFEFGTADNYYIAIGFNDPQDSYGINAIVYIDDVKITQELEAGTTFTRIFADNLAYNTSLYVATPGKEPSEKFYYYVYAVSNGTESTVYSKASERIEVGGQASVGNIMTGATSVSGEQGTICITTNNGCTASVYDTAGRKACSKALSPGKNTITIKPGVYIVACGSETSKVVVK